MRGTPVDRRACLGNRAKSNGTADTPGTRTPPGETPRMPGSWVSALISLSRSFSPSLSRMCVCVSLSLSLSLSVSCVSLASSLAALRLSAVVSHATLDHYRDTPLTRKRSPLGPYRRLTPGVLRGS